jgi:FkbM family methyltransferase
MNEPWMGDVIARALPHFPGDFVDIGVNLGQTLLRYRALESEHRYIGFEPNPNCVAFVAELIAINRIGNTTIIPAACALDYGIEKLQFYQDSIFDSSASLVSEFRPNQETFATHLVIAVPGAASLDAAVAGRVGIIKIDVEGFEATVMEGLEDRIAADRPCLLVEILPIYTSENRNRLESTARIETLALRQGYSIARIQKTRTGRLDRLELIQKIEIHQDLNLVDYILCPNERLSCLLSAP